MSEFNKFSSRRQRRELEEAKVETVEQSLGVSAPQVSRKNMRKLRENVEVSAENQFGSIPKTFLSDPRGIPVVSIVEDSAEFADNFVHRTRKDNFSSRARTHSVNKISEDFQLFGGLSDFDRVVKPELDVEKFSFPSPEIENRSKTSDILDKTSADIFINNFDLEEKGIITGSVPVINNFKKFDDVQVSDFHVVGDSSNNLLPVSALDVVEIEPLEFEAISQVAYKSKIWEMVVLGAALVMSVTGIVLFVFSQR